VIQDPWAPATGEAPGNVRPPRLGPEVPPNKHSLKGSQLERGATPEPAGGCFSVPLATAWQQAQCLAVKRGTRKHCFGQGVGAYTAWPAPTRP